MRQRYRMGHFATLILCAVTTLTAADVQAQQYPNRPLRLVVPFSAGGTTDLLARVLAQKSSEGLGQQVVVDNRGGASGIIACTLVANAANDGYTLLLGGNLTHAVNSSLRTKLPYDPIADFYPVTLAGSYAFILIAQPTVQAMNIRELVALAKNKPEALSYATGGVGSGNHLAAALFEHSAGVKLLAVHFKGGGNAVASLLSGEVALMFSAIPTALPHIRSGRLRAFGVTTSRRSVQLPDLPTIAEAGVPGYEVSSWLGIFVPARTPDAIVSKLNSVMVETLTQPQVKERFTELGADPLTSTPQEFAFHIKSETSKWARIIKESRITVN